MWTVTVFYRTTEGEPLDVIYDCNGLDIVPKLVMAGPPAETIEKILIEPKKEGTAIESFEKMMLGK